MIKYKNYFENKRITKQGFGVLGRGFGVVKFLLKNGAKLLVTDTREESFFKEQKLEIQKWMNENNISKDKIDFIFDEHRIKDFINCDYVISASGVAKDNPYLKAAKENNVPVYQESSLFLKIITDFNREQKIENKVRVITITGTRGKTTTTQLIYKILKDYYKDRNVYLGGNIQGISTIELLENIKTKDIVVMETDSWLAQGFEDIAFGSDIAVFTNLMRDHMNYYKGDMSDYFSDKAKAFLYQDENSTLIATEKLKIYLDEYLKGEYKNIYSNSKNKKIFITQKNIEDDKNIFLSDLKGEHNRVNISLAVRAALELDLDLESIKKSIKDFHGVSGRLEFVKESNSIKYYNDTTATTPDATIAAIDAFREEGNKLLLITGGRDKDLEVSNYIDKLISGYEQKKIKKIIFLSDGTTTGTEKILIEMGKKSFTNFDLAKSLAEAITLAERSAEAQDIILFSPGFVSFGMFLNEYDRGEKYLKLIS